MSKSGTHSIGPRSCCSCRDTQTGCPQTEMKRCAALERLRGAGLVRVIKQGSMACDGIIHSYLRRWTLQVPRYLLTFLCKPDAIRHDGYGISLSWMTTYLRPLASSNGERVSGHGAWPQP